MLGNTIPVTRCHIPEHPNTQLHNLKDGVQFQMNMLPLSSNWVVYHDDRGTNIIKSHSIIIPTDALI